MKEDKNIATPKVFISYSWTSRQHQEMVGSWADRLIADGVNVIIDFYDLKEGHDKYAFMEKMVTELDVSHVLVICDKVYAEKADARRAGVGTESQIISVEVYQKVEQSKFIPIVCEFIDGQPALPIFFKTRIWIDFSTPEKVNENWERLVRLLFGKPLYQKPALGGVPAYIIEHSAPPASPIRAKFESLRQAILQEKASIRSLRRDFLDVCIKYVDALRIRERPNAESFAQKIVEDCGKLVPVRDHLVDWVLLESEARPSEEFTASLIETLESLIEQKSRPAEVTSWNDVWFEDHKLFAYETFLYVVAALLKTASYDPLSEIFAAHYLQPESERYRSSDNFLRFDAFYWYSEAVNEALVPPQGNRYLSAAAELIRRQAQRSDLPFGELMQAELLVQLMAFITPDSRWFPQTLHYASHSPNFPFFVRATRRKDFKKLAKITGLESPEELRVAVKKGLERLQPNSFGYFRVSDFSRSLNLDRFGSID